MPSLQSPPDPAPAPDSRQSLRFSDAGWVAAYCMTGLFELVRARIAFAQLEARDIPARNRRAAERASAITPQGGQAALLARVSYVLPRISVRLPWRSDCLVQAIAGQNWLARRGLPSEIRIGVERPESGPFGAHAWLVHEDAVITGGDISRYSLLLGEPRKGQSDA
jgi:hypothetical protein